MFENGVLTHQKADGRSPPRRSIKTARFYATGGPGPRSFESKTALHHAGMRARHVDSPFEAKKIRRMQQVDVQRVAFDPFATIEQSPQIA